MAYFKTTKTSLRKVGSSKQRFTDSKRTQVGKIIKFLSAKEDYEFPAPYMSEKLKMKTNSLRANLASLYNAGKLEKSKEKGEPVYYSIKQVK